MHTFKEFYLLTEKASTKGTEYGCLMAMFSKQESTKFIKFAKQHIDKKDLAKDGNYEDEPHITVLYGFHGDLSEELKSLLHRWGSLTVTLGNVSRFKGKERDVLKVAVKSSDIKKLHGFLMKHYPKMITTDFPEWNGHITLAYVNPGACKELDGNPTFAGKEVTFQELVYSTPGMHKKTKFKIVQA